MKKNSGGYVLVYVLIVIVLLSLLALGVCSIALRNLQTQQASVEQMQEHYEVEGNMERFVAKLQAFQENSSVRYNSQTEAQSAAHDGSGHTEYSYNIQKSTFTYDSYDISTGRAAGDEGGEAA